MQFQEASVAAGKVEPEVSAATASGPVPEAFVAVGNAGPEVSAATASEHVQVTSAAWSARCFAVGVRLLVLEEMLERVVDHSPAKLLGKLERSV